MLGLCMLAACAESPAPPPWVEPPHKIGWHVFFDSGSSALSSESRQTLTKIATTPRGEQWLQLPSSFKYCLVGSTDNTGSEATNKSLSRRRAEVAAAYLVELGVPQERLVVKARGSSALLVKTPPNTPEMQNRRVEIFSSGKGCEHLRE